MCPYKRPYNSGTIRIRLLPSPSVMAALTCGKRPVGHRPAPPFPCVFRIPKPCRSEVFAKLVDKVVEL
jgi:hypothetical protein